MPVPYKSPREGPKTHRGITTPWYARHFATSGSVVCWNFSHSNPRIKKWQNLLYGWSFAIQKMQTTMHCIKMEAEDFSSNNDQFRQHISPSAEYIYESETKTTADVGRLAKQIASKIKARPRILCYQIRWALGLWIGWGLTLIIFMITGFQRSFSSLNAGFCACIWFNTLQSLHIFKKQSNYIH